MAIELITQKTEEEKAQELADIINGLRSTQYRIIETLKTFKTDIENLAAVFRAQQEEINKINRRDRNKAKRGGYDVDDKEEVGEESSDIEPISG